jgi:translocation protein SEC63
LQYHPDKQGGNAELFQRIAKAYEALTDPIARENYEKYGNPDGRQALEVSIGLPSFIIEGKSKYVFLAMYLIFLVVLIPTIMCWFYKSNNESTFGGLQQISFEWLKYRINHDLTYKAFPSIMAGCKEFHASALIVSKEIATAETNEIKRLVTTLVAEKRMLHVQPPERSALPPEILYRNEVILVAYLNRFPINEPTMRETLKTMVAKFDNVFSVALELCIQRTALSQNPPPNMPKHMIPASHLQSAFAVIDFSQRFIQALWIKDTTHKHASFCQLFNEDIAKSIFISSKTAGGAASLLGWLQHDPSVRAGLSMLSEEERTDLNKFVNDLPVLNVDSSIKVLDEDVIAEGDVLTATLKIVHENLKGGKDVPVPPVYAPYYPLIKQEEWSVFILDSKDRFLCHKLLSEMKAEMTETLMFPGPVKAGTYTYKILVKSHCYLGLDISQEVTINVVPKSELPEWKEHEEDAALEGSKEQALEAMMVSGVIDESDTEDEDDKDDRILTPSPAAAVKKTTNLAALSAKTTAQQPPAAATAASDAAPASPAAVTGDDDDDMPSLLSKKKTPMK